MRCWLTPSPGEDSPLPLPPISCREVLLLVLVRRGRYLQRVFSKGLTAKLLQSNGLWEGAEVGIGVFAHGCAALFGRSPVFTCCP